MDLYSLFEGVPPKVVLLSISKLLMVISAFCLAVITIKLHNVRQRINAFTLIVLLSCLLSLIHQHAEVFMLDLGQVPEYTELIRVVWYLFFGISDMLYVALCLWLCKWLRLKSDVYSTRFLYCYLISASMQFIRFIDRIVIKTDVLGDVYTVVVVSANVAISVLAVMALCTVVKNDLRGTERW